MASAAQEIAQSWDEIALLLQVLANIMQMTAADPVA